MAAARRILRRLRTLLAPGNALRRFRQIPHARARGQAGEDLAARWLRRQGYRILVRNHSNPAGEIDLVAQEGSVLCFIEIKARSSERYGRSLEAVPLSKQRRIARAAQHYLSSHPSDLACRFDVLGMDLDSSGRWQFSLVRDAFQVPDTR